MIKIPKVIKNPLKIKFRFVGKLRKIGNGYGFLIPKEIADRLDLDNLYIIEVEVTDLGVKRVEILENSGVWILSSAFN